MNKYSEEQQQSKAARDAANADWVKHRMCERKVAYETYAQARHDTNQDAYQCPHCLRWHRTTQAIRFAWFLTDVGHKKRIYKTQHHKHKKHRRRR